MTMVTVGYRVKEIKEAGEASICPPDFLGSTFVE